MPKDFIGNPRKQHPIPIRLRSQFIEKADGGSKGYRGKGYTLARLRAIYLARGRSVATGLSASEATLFVDHINPYRLGITPDTNRQVNLRVLDSQNNSALDNVKGMGEKPPRRLRAW